LQQETGFGNQQSNGAFILNPLRQRQNYSSSDFDIRHNINANAVWQMPFGKGRAFLNGAPKAVDAILGAGSSPEFSAGTQAAYSRPFDEASGRRTGRGVECDADPSIQSCPSKPKDSSAPKLSAIAMYRDLSEPSTGLPRRIGPAKLPSLPGYVALDLGVGKTWRMPWNEAISCKLRWMYLT